MTQDERCAQPQWLVSSYWRGSLNIKNLRVFDDYSMAKAYALSLDPPNTEPDQTGYFSTFVRVYQVTANDAPLQIKRY